MQPHTNHLDDEHTPVELLQTPTRPIFPSTPPSSGYPIEISEELGTIDAEPTTQTSPLSLRMFETLPLSAHTLNSKYPLSSAPTPPVLERYYMEYLKTASKNARDRPFKKTPWLSDLEKHVVGVDETPSGGSSRRLERKTIRIPESFKHPIDNRTTVLADSNQPALPSPCLSPTFSAVRNSNYFDEDEIEESLCFGEMEVNGVLNVFDNLPHTLQSYLLFQMLKRCPTSTLQYVSSLILPTLRRDILGDLPFEIALKIVGFLDSRSLCRAAQVSRRWRYVIDSEPSTWKRLMDRDGYHIDEDDQSTLSQHGQGRHGFEGINILKNSLQGVAKNSNAASLGFLDYPQHTRLQALKAVDRFDYTNTDNTFEASYETTSGPTSPEDQDGEETDSLSSYSSTTQSPLDDIEESYTIIENFETTSVMSDIRPQTSSSVASSSNDPTVGTTPVRKTLRSSRLQPSLSQRNRQSQRNVSLDSDDTWQHSFKDIYRRHHLLHQNWLHGRASTFSFPGHGSHVVTCLQFDSDKIVSGSDDQCINIYDTKSGQLRTRLIGHDGGVWALQYVQNTLVSGSTDRTVRVWDVEKGLCTHVFHGHTSTVRCLQIVVPINVNPDPNGEPIMEPPYPVIVTGSRDSTLRVWRLPTPEFNPDQGSSVNYPIITSSANNPYLLHTLTGHTHSVRALAGHGNLVVSGSYDCTVRVWNLMTGENIWRLVGHTQKVYSVVLDRERNRCMSGSMDFKVRVWNLENGSCLYVLEGHSSLVGLLNLTPDYLVSAAADSTLRIWSPSDGTCLNVLSAHTGAITCFQHDGTKVISGSDGTLKMWDIRTGRLIRDLIQGLSGVWQVQFDHRRCVAAVQRQGQTWFEVMDFGIHGIRKE